MITKIIGFFGQSTADTINPAQQTKALNSLTERMRKTRIDLINAKHSPDNPTHLGADETLRHRFYTLKNQLRENIEAGISAGLNTQDAYGALADAGATYFEYYAHPVLPADILNHTREMIERDYEYSGHNNPQFLQDLYTNMLAVHTRSLHHALQQNTAVNYTAHDIARIKADMFSHLHSINMLRTELSHLDTTPSSPDNNDDDPTLRRKINSHVQTLESNAAAKRQRLSSMLTASAAPLDTQLTYITNGKTTLGYSDRRAAQNYVDTNLGFHMS